MLNIFQFLQSLFCLYRKCNNGQCVTGKDCAAYLKCFDNTFEKKCTHYFDEDLQLANAFNFQWKIDEVEKEILFEYERVNELSNSPGKKLFNNSKVYFEYSNVFPFSSILPCL